MNYITHQLLNTKEIELINEVMNQSELPWEDGKKTAGNHAATEKNNKQLDRESIISKKYAGLIEKIINNILIKSFALPKRIHGTMFSKSTKGMKYGRHIDNAFMSSGRSDLSFTRSLVRKINIRVGNYRLNASIQKKNLN